ncbi:MATE family efflux transporter [Sediminitomix flava]|uniref:Multidrug export protein MepA n=1 Tax=Sediminitomix flava TaxID=379075 RepID=A0A315ZH60_SEDFL|nr:MATE family efflux transporter [Sediminitomix flava]PWJ44916.1 putative MATE family efflux protein [Sediminitomix flava]
MKPKNEMAESPIKDLLRKYFWPAFVSVFVNALYNIVDRIFIGQGVGAEALSGLSVVFPIMMIISAFGMMIGQGAGARVSINMGEGNLKRAEWVLGNALLLGCFVSILVTGIGFAIKTPLLNSFGATENTLVYAQDYLNIILFGAIFQNVGFSLNNIIRSQGNARIAMSSMIVSAGTNIILDPIFIFGLNMGVKGAAWATIISNIVLCIYVIHHYLKSEHAIVKFKTHSFKLNKQIITSILSIGMAPFALQIGSSFVQAAANFQLISYGGDLAIGAMGIINSIVLLVILTIFAVSMASQPIVGFNFGARDFSRVKETLRLSIIAATVISIVSWIVIHIFPNQFVQLFNTDSDELLQIGTRGLNIYTMCMPVIGFQIITSQYFQATSKAKISIFLTLLRQVIVMMPFLFILPNFFGLDGVWMVGPVSDTLSALFTSIFLVKEWKKLNLLIENVG